MSPSKMAIFYGGVARIAKAIKTSMEEMENHLDEPVIADYYSNLASVNAELEATLYALEVMDEGHQHDQRYH